MFSSWDLLCVFIMMALGLCLLGKKTADMKYHRIEGTCYEHDVSLLTVTFIIRLSSVCRFLHSKVTLPCSPFPVILFGKKVATSSLYVGSRELAP